MAAALAAAPPLAGQGGMGGSALFVNSESESYLRNLQVAGVVSPYPWSIRGFSPRELERLAPREGAAHPWAALRGTAAAPPARGLSLLPAEVRTTLNSAFPFGGNDGPVWTGRGVTAAAQAGVAGRFGRLSFTLAPVVFWAQNAEFGLLSTGGTADAAFGDARRPAMDYPQRFGDGAYARVDPGQCGVRLDLPGVALGVSTASQHWGPAAENPLLLGNNAGGFPHAFAGTAAPVNVGVGRLHARLVWGALSQSEYAPVRPPGQNARRFMSGLVAVFTPRGIPGLEVGGATFVHTPWPAGGLSLSDLGKPFEGLYETGENRTPGGPGSGADNQIATVFARWVFPRAGLEVYGEYGRDDQAYGLRDLLVEPDHDAAYTLGFRKVWLRETGSLVALRGEVLSTQLSHLALVSNRARFYTHNSTRQGHTLRGQILGAPAGHGGAGALLAADLLHPKGRWTLSLSRELRRDRADYALDLTEDGGPDVQGALGIEAVRFTGRMDLTAGVRAVYERNRDFGGDAFNLNAVLGLRAALD